MLLWLYAMPVYCRPHDASAASIAAVQHASWWWWTTLPRAAESNGYDGPGQSREPCHGTETNATLQTSAARYSSQPLLGVQVVSVGLSSL